MTIPIILFNNQMRKNEKRKALEKAEEERIELTKYINNILDDGFTISIREDYRACIYCKDDKVNERQFITSEEIENLTMDNIERYCKGWITEFKSYIEEKYEE